MSSTEIDRMVIESADGREYLVTLRDDDTLTVADVTGLDDLDSVRPVGTWALSALKDVTGALAIDLGRGMILDQTATAITLQWARVK